MSRKDQRQREIRREPEKPQGTAQVPDGVQTTLATKEGVGTAPIADLGPPFISNEEMQRRIDAGGVEVIQPATERLPDMVETHSPSWNATENGLTALDLLEQGHIIPALELLEDLRESVRIEPGQPIPFDRLPILPIGEKFERFAAVWESIKAAQFPPDAITARMAALEVWLVDLEILPPIAPLTVTQIGDKIEVSADPRVHTVANVEAAVEAHERRQIRAIQPGSGASILAGETVRLEPGEHVICGLGYRTKYPVLMTMSQHGEVMFDRPDGVGHIEVEGVAAVMQEPTPAPRTINLPLAIRSLGQAKEKGPEWMKEPIQKIIGELVNDEAVKMPRLRLIHEALAHAHHPAAEAVKVAIEALSLS